MQALGEFLSLASQLYYFFYTGVTTLFRDPWGGLSLVPLITILLRFVLLIFRGLFNCWCEENTGNTS